MVSYYDQSYFEYQKPSGNFGGKAELLKFDGFIRSTDLVGCGGGFLLAELDCRERIGIEVNPSAQEHARGFGFPVFSDFTSIEDRWADVVISNHALEHSLNPYLHLLEAHRVLKQEGLAVFVVPCERHDTVFKQGDINKHLYTWSPMNLGNLFVAAGFKIVECREFVHRWPPRRGAELIARHLGWSAFHLSARVWGTISRRCSQVRVVARRP
jgi:SAM-dependent methyltransferase